MVVHWPARITDTGALRSRFTHVIDVGPTILDIAGIPAPSHVDRIEQQPLHGVTFADSLADAAAPERHTQQYFEIMGDRAMYKDGWPSCAMFWINAAGRRRDDRVRGFPAGAVSGDDRVGCKLLEGADGICDGRLEQRPGEVGPADDRVQLADAGQALGVPADVDQAGVPGSRSGRPARVRRRWRSAPSHLSQRVGLPAAAAPGLVDRESLLEAGDQVDLAGNQHRPVIQERGLLLDDVEADAGSPCWASGASGVLPPCSSGLSSIGVRQQQVHGVVADDQHNQLVDRLERVLLADPRNAP